MKTECVNESEVIKILKGFWMEYDNDDNGTAQMGSAVTEQSILFLTHYSQYSPFADINNYVNT
jgi:hypothetical protein